MVFALARKLRSARRMAGYPLCLALTCHGVGGCKTTGSATKSLETPAVITDTTSSLRVISGDPRTILVLFTGAYMKPAAYSGLAQQIVQASGGSIGVFIPHFLGDFSNPLQSDGAVNEAVQYLKGLGVENPNSQVFLAGHSAGGIFANDAPLRFKLGGLILLASYLPHTPVIGKHLGDYGRPVLTLGGELDGLTGINYMAREYAAMSELAAKDPGVLIEKPVIVLRAVKHSQFADGQPADGDVIDGAISYDEAQALIAGTVVNFIAAHSAEGALKMPQKSAASAALKHAIEDSAPLLNPYKLADKALPELCQVSQKASFALAGDGWSKVDFDVKIYDTLLSQPAFVFDKSSVTKVADRVKLHVPTFIDYARNVSDVSRDRYLSPRSVACKMRSQEAFVAESGLASSGAQRTCAELNVDVIKSSLELVTDSGQRQRLVKRYGEPSKWDVDLDSTDEENRAVFGPFKIRSSRKSTGQGFVAAKFSLDRESGSNDSWVIETAELVTGKTAVIQQFAGASYCKLLAPARVIEWATLFGLK